MADSTQVCEVFRRVQHSHLQDTVKALKVRADLDVITYLEAANRLTDSVSNMPEYQFSWKVSGVQSSGGNSRGNKGGGSGPRKGGRNSGSIYNSQGKVDTDYYQNYKILSKEYRKTIMYAQKKKGSNYSKTASKKDVSYTKLQISKLS